MRVLLTGASGFVGSHILDQLRSQGIPAAVLLRPTSSRAFIQQHLPELEIRSGSINDPASLPAALAGITHLVHCAGCTRALRHQDFYAVNRDGTRNLVDAANATPGLQQFIHISSLAVTGPATPARPAREEDPPHPVSEYGKSKLAGEQALRERCRVPWTVLRPPGIYGPRDYGFLSMFEAVRRHILPRPTGAQALSLVYVEDLAGAVRACLDHPDAAGKVFFVASPEITTASLMAQEIASEMGTWTVPCPVPAALLWPVCLFQQLISRMTGKPTLLNLQKFGELRAPGWVCDTSRLEGELGFKCSTSLKNGVTKTLNWYRQEKWI